MGWGGQVVLQKQISDIISDISVFIILNHAFVCAPQKE